MCLGTTGKIVKIEDGKAVIDVNGVSLTAITGLVKDLQVGDMVMVHAGCVIQKINPDEAAELQKLANEIAEVMKKKD